MEGDTTEKLADERQTSCMIDIYECWLGVKWIITLFSLNYFWSCVMRNDLLTAGDYDIEKFVPFNGIVPV